MRLILPTGDGSCTLKDFRTGETYHSEYGALQESLHIYIGLGFEEWIVRNSPSSNQTVHILEMGFGTGLNALLTWKYALQYGVKVMYHTYELYPLADEIPFLKYEVPNSECLQTLHHLGWNCSHLLDSYFSIHKHHEDFTRADVPEGIDIVYYDAFSPNVQPELWRADIFVQLYEKQNPKGILTTYCAKGEVRRALTAVGYGVERLGGPKGKREVLRATKLS